MKNKTVIFLLSLLLIAMGSVLYAFLVIVPAKEKEQVNLEMEMNTLKKSVEYLNEDIDVFLKNELLAIESEQIRINPELVLRSSISDSFKLKDKIGTGKMFFYFGEYSCQECYQEVIHKLNRYMEMYNSKNIIIVAHFENFRQFHFFVKNATIRAPIYYTAKELELPVEKSHQPFFFVLDSSFQTKRVFIPNKKYNENLDTYLKLADKIKS